jgi:superfamily II DNA/RNA helicase
MISRFLKIPQLLRARRPRNAALFNTTGLTDDLLRAVEQMEITQASPEQVRATNAALDGRHVGLFTGTGSGKTLAYLLPVACRLKADEDFQLEHLKSLQVEQQVEQRDGEREEEDVEQQLFRPEPRRPRAIVLAPSRELCVQITTVAKSLAHHCKLKIVGLDGGGSMKSQRERLESGVDLVVATPGRLQRHRENNNLYLSKVLCLVLDEADALVSTEFGQEAIDIVEALTARDNSEKRSKRRGPFPEKCLFTVASATSSSHRLSRLMKTHMPNVAVVKEEATANGGRGKGKGKGKGTKRLGGASARRNEIFVFSPGRDKYTTLSSVIKSPKIMADNNKYDKHELDGTLSEHQQVFNAGHEGEPTLVFCNSVSSCRSAEHYLREQGHSSVSYHSDMPSNIRSDHFKMFQTSKVNVMVCTDIAARGLDLRHVRHVVNLDFPRTSEWYLHRAGRTARAGDAGKVTSIYTKYEKDQALEMEAHIKSLQHNQHNQTNPNQMKIGGTETGDAGTGTSGTATKRRRKFTKKKKKNTPQRGVIYSNRQ